ncbi:Glycosyl hydrolases family 28 [Granulicella rosea]|uniref:Glycosyl hydrolases family 28 n=1 Tax=Granulicella rosea TaxID=474952 RepID=A0A239LXI0_9BACT|nr:glycosyl hydrolase family 28 protein [Granulicella rosea]SNT34672.1 Glycosyl hydrolases family 28 [Granulicella rosea]
MRNVVGSVLIRMVVFAVTGGVLGCSSGSSPVPPVTVTISGAGQVRASASAQLSATLTNTNNTNVTWQVNGAAGGSAATGTISATGLYVAPATLPSPNAVTITAISQASPSASASVQETILNPLPILAAATATPTGSTGALLLDVRGSGFVAGSQIQLAGATQTTQVISSSELQATFNPLGAASVTVSVTNPDPGSSLSNVLTVSLPIVMVGVSGAAQTRLGQTTQFAATVSGSSNTAVTWQVNGVTGGATATGTISATGLYTAPAVLPAPNTVTIAAVSQAYTTVSGSLQETILNPVSTVSAVVPTLTNTAGTVLLDVTGTSFAGGAQIQAGGSSLTTTWISATELQANYNPAAGATSVTITTLNPNDGAIASNALTVTLPTIYAYTGPVPADETLSPYFTMSAGGVPLHAYWSTVRSVNFAQFKSGFTGQYYYPDAPYNATSGIATFASIQLNGSSQVSIAPVSGYPKTGAITSSSQVKILPAGAIDPAAISIVNGAIQFTVAQTGVPLQLTIEVDGDWLNSVHLFVNPFEVAPVGGSIIPPGYITQATIDSYKSPYIFQPGEYWINGNIDFRGDSDIYLEDGAILKWVTPFYPQLNTNPMITLGGNPAAPNVNMYLHGSGIIDGQSAQQYAANNGNGCGYNALLLAINNLNLTATNKAGVDGVILRNSCTFNMPISKVVGYPSNHFVINNVKILGFQGNSDGIDIFTDQYLDITHSFFRTADDLIVVYQQNIPSAYPTAHITATNNILWNELAHALAVGSSDNSTLASDPVAVDTVLFDHNDVIHDTGKAFLLGVFQTEYGIIQNITFSNNTIEETKSAIGVFTSPALATSNPGVIGSVTFSNINITAAQQVNTVNTYVVPLPNIQMLVQLPYGDNYIGDGTTTSASPAVIQGPIVFNNVVADGKPVVAYTNSPGYLNALGNAVPENVIAAGVTLRNATYGAFINEPSQVAGDILAPYCGSARCPLQP